MGTINVRVNSIANNGIAYGTDSSLRQSANICWGQAGATGTYSTYLMFEGITIPVGAIITESYITFVEGVNVGTPAGRIYFEDVAAPSIPTSYADYYGKTKTTNYVAIGSVVGTQNSSSLNAIIQELVDSHAPYSDGKMQALIYKISGDGNYCIPKSYDNDSALAALLHIVFTAPGFKGAQVIIA